MIVELVGGENIKRKKMHWKLTNKATPEIVEEPNGSSKVFENRSNPHPNARFNGKERELRIIRKFDRSFREQRNRFQNKIKKMIFI